MTPPAEHSRKGGLIMYGIGWAILMALLVLSFSQWHNQREHPNQNLSQSEGGHLILEANYRNHYLVDGTINGIRTTFLIDTGASHVVIPAEHARRIGLQTGPALTAATANGPVTVYRTTIKQLNIGPLSLHNIPASINPAMSGDQALLGMSALKWLEIRQQGSQLQLSQ